MKRVRLLVAAALVCTVTAAPAAAEDVGIEEAAQRAEDAGTSEAGRAAFERITSVDGVPVDSSLLLDGDPADVARRLATISELTPTSATGSATEARADATKILEGAEYQRTTGEPGVATRIAEWFADLIPDSVGSALASPTLWIVLAVAALLVGLTLGLRATGRRRRTERGSSSAGGAPLPQTAAEVERRARSAAEAGDYSTAVRLWFRAGAIRLADRGLVPHESTSTSGVIRRVVPSPTMAALASTFDQVAYGRRAATSDDADAAADGWAHVLSEMNDG